MLFSISKQSLSKLAGQAMPMTGVLSPLFTTRDKKKSDPFAREKKDSIKICVKFLVSSIVIKKREFSFPKSYQHKSMEVK